MSDFSELAKLAQDLGDVPDEVAPNVRKAVQVTSLKIKKDWRAAADRSGLGGYAADVTYETKELAHSIVSEIGPTPGDQGSFGLVEDARGDVKSAPQHAGRDAARKNEADFIEGLAKAAGDIL
jgi:hypothetical protein